MTKTRRSEIRKRARKMVKTRRSLFDNFRLFQTEELLTELFISLRYLYNV